MNRSCYNNLFQFMQHGNFRYLNRVIFTHWIHLQSQVNVFWYCFPVIKQYTFHYLMKSALIPGNQSTFKIMLFFDIWCYQCLIILFFSSAGILILNKLDSETTELDLNLTRLSAIISTYLTKFMKHSKSNTAFSHEIVIIFLQFIYQRPLMWLAHSI